MSGTQPIPTPAPAPSRSEVQRKLSLKSVSRDPAAKPRRPSASTPTTPGLTGYDSDSSYTSSQPVGAHSQAGAASASSPSVKAMTLNSLQNPGPLAAIAERERKREGVLVLSDEEEEEGEGEGEGEGDGIECEAEAEADGSDAEERVQGPEAGQLRQGVEGERVLRTGYLDKKGERRKSWQRRWFVLRTAKLAYYKDEKEYVLCRIIDLRNIHTVASVQLKRHAHGFGIVTPQRTYYLKAGSHAEMEGWVMALNEVRRNLAEGDERARQPLAQQQQQQQQQGLGLGQAAVGAGASTVGPVVPNTTSNTGAPAPAPGLSSTGKMPPLQIPRKSSADAQSPPLVSALQTPTASTSTSTPSRAGSLSLGLGTPLEASLNRLGLGAPSPQATPSERDRQSRERAISSSRRDTSASSVSSAGGGRGAYSGSQSAGEAHLADPVAATSSDEDDVYAPALMRLALAPGASGRASAGQNPAAAPAERVQIQTDPNKVILSGYLMKLGLKRKVWRKRWFVLTSGLLVYTKSHMDTKVHRQIPLAVILDALEWESPHSPLTVDSDSASDAGGPGGGGPSSGPLPSSRGDSRRPRFGREPSTSASAVQHTFQVITPKRTFKLCAPTEEDEIKWLAALRTLINRERGMMSPAIGGSLPLPQPGSGAGAGAGPANWGTGRRPSQTMAVPAMQTPGVPSIQEHPPSPAARDEGVSAGAQPEAGVPPPQPAHAHAQQAGEGGSYFGAAAGVGPSASTGSGTSSGSGEAGRHLTSSSETTLHAPTGEAALSGGSGGGSNGSGSATGIAPPLSPLYTLPSTTSSTSATFTTHSPLTPSSPSPSPALPPPPPTQRTRSATQSAKNAVEVAVRRLHLGQGQQHGGHGGQHGQGHGQQVGQHAHGHTHLNVVTSAEEGR